MATQEDQTMRSLSTGITGQENMSGTSVIRDILWLVQRSEDVYPAVNGVDMCQHVSHLNLFLPKEFSLN